MVLGYRVACFIGFSSPIRRTWEGHVLSYSCVQRGKARGLWKSIQYESGTLLLAALPNFAVGLRIVIIPDPIFCPYDLVAKPSSVAFANSSVSLGQFCKSKLASHSVKHCFFKQEFHSLSSHQIHPRTETDNLTDHPNWIKLVIMHTFSVHLQVIIMMSIT